MAFAFNFSGDDIDPDDSGADNVSSPLPPIAAPAPPLPPSVPVLTHSLEEWLASLPSQLSYTLHPLTPSLSLPRRELFDTRTQLMAEDDDAAVATAVLLGSSDLHAAVYEGGFKTWECAADLGRLLSSRAAEHQHGDGEKGGEEEIEEEEDDTVVELGAGSAVPSLVLFARALRPSGAGRRRRKKGFVLADYNADVLRLVTVPNLLLVYAAVCEGLGDTALEGELEVTPELVARFTATLEERGISVQLVSGPWGEELAGLLHGTEGRTLVLAAETIYDPRSLGGFVQVLQTVLGRDKRSTALVAAKRFYFGVGGSVDALLQACGDHGLVAQEVQDSGVPGMDSGVGRAIVEVRAQ